MTIQNKTALATTTVVVTKPKSSSLASGAAELTGAAGMAQFAERYPAHLRPWWWDGAVKTMERLERMTPEEAESRILAALRRE